MTIAILSLLIVVAITMLITRLASMALVLTGMSAEAARFQARSALAGVGFTTREAEQVVNHPVRRRIIMLLMMTGSISVPTVIAALGVSLFTTLQREQWWWPALALAVGLLVLFAFARSRWIETHLNRLMGWALVRWTNLDVRDYVSLLQLQNGFAVTEMIVDPGDWLDGRTLQNANLSHEGILVLGIQREGGEYIGTPGAMDVIQAGDTLVLYGQIDRLKELDQRDLAMGDTAHRKAEADHAAQIMGQTPDLIEAPDRPAGDRNESP